MVTTLQPWREANIYNVTRSPGRIIVGSTWKDADHPGRGADWMDAGTSPSHRRCVVVVGGLVWWRCVDCCRASECHPAPASITTCRRLSLCGWSHEW